MHTDTYRSPWRWPAALLLLVTAAVHVPLIPDHLEEAPYVGRLFIGLTVISVVLAVVLVRHDTSLVWLASGVVTTLALLAFVASRTIGLPELSDDIGNWTEPLGIPALAAELLTASIASLVLLRSHGANHGRNTA